MACIIRAILDAFWSRAEGTVSGYARNARKMIEHSETAGLYVPFRHSAQLPWEDHCGYEVAVEMLLYSRKEGKNSKDYMQFDTVRVFRTIYSNFVRASPQANAYPLSLGEPSGKYQRLNMDSCGSLWFSRFMEGLKARMGQIWLPNRAMSNQLQKEFLRLLEKRIRDAEDDFKEKHRWIVFSLYVTAVYVLSLRGPEGFLLDIDGLNRHWDGLRYEYVVFALLGKIKGEANDRDHLIPCVCQTSSGIRVRDILKRFLDIKTVIGQRDGPAISDIDGKLYGTKDLDDMLHDILLDIFEVRRELFPADISSSEEVMKHYQCFRTFSRSSDTRAIDTKVSSVDIDVVNRWRGVERAGGKRPARYMQQHYAQFELLLGPFLRYTEAM